MTRENARKLNSGRRTQRDHAIELLARNGMMRTSELVQAGVAATTVSRMSDDGLVIKLSRGLYQLADAPIDINHDLAEAAKRVPKGVVCLVSALAFHGLTDQIPRRIWLAIGSRDWQPNSDGPKLELIRLTERQLRDDVETHEVEHVPVRIFDIPRTIVDCFRFRRSVGLPVAIEALREALRLRKTTPTEIAQRARSNKTWSVVRPYLEAFTIDG